MFFKGVDKTSFSYAYSNYEQHMRKMSWIQIM